MKYFLIMMLLVFNVSRSKDYNVIVSVDGKVGEVIFIEFEIGYVDNNGENKVLESKYMPGELTLDDKEVEAMMLIKPDVLTISFYLYDLKLYKNGDRKYEIQISTFLLADDSYLVLNIYNTDKDCFGKVFNPLPGKNYTFEYTSGTYPSARRMTKIDRESCDCL